MKLMHEELYLVKFLKTKIGINIYSKNLGVLSFIPTLDMETMISSDLPIEDTVFFDGMEKLILVQL